MVEKFLKLLKNNSLLNHIFIWSSGSFVENTSKTIILFYLAYSIDKYSYGSIILGILIFNYFNFLQFGITDFLQNYFPKLYYKKKIRIMAKFLCQSLLFTFIVQLSFIIVIILFLNYLSINYFDKYVIVFYLFFSILYQVYFYIIIFLKSNFKFKEIQKIRLSRTGYRFVVQIPAIYFFGIKGFLISEFCLLTLSCFMVYLFTSNNLFLEKIKLSMIKKLVLKSLPFFIITCISYFNNTIDRIILNINLDNEKLAEYGLLFQMIAVIAMIPNQSLSIFNQYLREYLTKYKYKFNFIIQAQQEFIMIFNILFLPLSIILIIFGQYFLSIFFFEYKLSTNNFYLGLLIFLTIFNTSFIRSFFIITNKVYTNVKNYLILFVIIITTYVYFYSISYKLDFIQIIKLTFLFFLLDYFIAIMTLITKKLIKDYRIFIFNLVLLFINYLLILYYKYFISNLFILLIIFLLTILIITMLYKLRKINNFLTISKRNI